MPAKLTSFEFDGVNKEESRGNIIGFKVLFAETCWCDFVSTYAEINYTTEIIYFTILLVSLTFT